MNILVTGAKGMVGTALCNNLKNIRDGKNKTRPALNIEEIYEYDLDSTPAELDEYCRKANFVFNLAGVNRPKNPEAFQKGNVDFTREVLESLRAARNDCPVMLASSVQAVCLNPYGESKRQAEELVWEHGKETGARVLIYRFPNLFGKWNRPNYNSVVATFCDHIARDLPIRVDDPATELTMAYIDDVVEALLLGLLGREERKNDFCVVKPEFRVTLQQITDWLYRFQSQSRTLVVPEMPPESFQKRLYATYLSYLPMEKAAYMLKSKADERGSFTEVLKPENGGQFSINVLKPGVTKGRHWHNTKWEIFIVVSGQGLIRQRKIGSNEIAVFEVNGEKPEAVYMLPGYTHEIQNRSETEELILVIWANEAFEPEHPDTFFEEV